jgi:hypothetical protein
LFVVVVVVIVVVVVVVVIVVVVVVVVSSSVVGSWNLCQNSIPQADTVDSAIFSSRCQAADRELCAAEGSVNPDKNVFLVQLVVCMYADFYISAVSAWTLATPRVTW